MMDRCGCVACVRIYGLCRLQMETAHAHIFDESHLSFWRYHHHTHIGKHLNPFCFIFIASISVEEEKNCGMRSCCSVICAVCHCAIHWPCQNIVCAHLPPMHDWLTHLTTAITRRHANFRRLIFLDRANTTYSARLMPCMWLCHS